MMSTYRSFLVGLALAAGLAFGVPALAANKHPFTQTAFSAAQQADRPILVEVSAPWCNTCKAQKAILMELTGDPRFEQLAMFEVDFDTQEEAVRGFRVQKQSTLIVFKGTREVGRSTGDTNRDSIAALLEKAI